MEIKPAFNYTGNTVHIIAIILSGIFMKFINFLQVILIKQLLISQWLTKDKVQQVKWETQKNLFFKFI